MFRFVSCSLAWFGRNIWSTLSSAHLTSSPRHFEYSSLVSPEPSQYLALSSSVSVQSVSSFLQRIADPFQHDGGEPFAKQTPRGEYSSAGSSPAQI